MNWIDEYLKSMNVVSDTSKYCFDREQIKSAILGFSDYEPQGELDVRIAIVVGHTSTFGGAFSKFIGKNEYKYHTESVTNELKKLGADIYTHSIWGGYKTRQNAMANKLNKENYDIVLELHFNSFNTSTAHGTEALYYVTSSWGKEFAKIFSDKISVSFRLKNRGAKSVINSKDRGYWFLQKQKAVAVILEPFFGSNGGDVGKVLGKEKEYARLIIETCKEWFKKKNS